MAGARKVKTLHEAGQTADVKLDPDTGHFFCIFNKKKHTAATLAEVETAARAAMRDVTDVEWRRVIFIDRPSAKEPAGTRHVYGSGMWRSQHVEYTASIDMEFFRCETAVRGGQQIFRMWFDADGLSERDRIKLDEHRATFGQTDEEYAEAVAERVEHGHDARAHREGRTLVDAFETHGQSNSSRYIMLPYTDEVWALLLDVRARVGELSARLHDLLAPERIALIASAGVAGFLGPGASTRDEGTES